jgi:hypothetical protein
MGSGKLQGHSACSAEDVLQQMRRDRASTSTKPTYSNFLS